MITTFILLEPFSAVWRNYTLNLTESSSLALLYFEAFLLGLAYFSSHDYNRL